MGLASLPLPDLFLMEVAWEPYWRIPTYYRPVQGLHLDELATRFPWIERGYCKRSYESYFQVDVEEALKKRRFMPVQLTETPRPSQSLDVLVGLNEPDRLVEYITAGSYAHRHTSFHISPTTSQVPRLGNWPVSHCFSLVLSKHRSYVMGARSMA